MLLYMHSSQHRLVMEQHRDTSGLVHAQALMPEE